MAYAKGNFNGSGECFQVRDFTSGFAGIMPSQHSLCWVPLHPSVPISLGKLHFQVHVVDPGHTWLPRHYGCSSLRLTSSQMRSFEGKNSSFPLPQDWDSLWLDWLISCVLDWACHCGQLNTLHWLVNPEFQTPAWSYTQTAWTGMQVSS